MADLLFLERKEGEIVKLEGDNFIHDYVETARKHYNHHKIVEEIYKRVSSIEHDPCVRDRLMGRLFLIPRLTHVFYHLSQNTDEEFEKLIEELKNCLSYLLFPVTIEFEREIDRKFGSGGALLRSLLNIPRDTFTYFQQQGFMGLKY